jgi:hypothetical protein
LRFFGNKVFNPVVGTLDIAQKDTLFAHFVGIVIAVLGKFFKTDKDKIKIGIDIFS